MVDSNLCYLGKSISKYKLHNICIRLKMSLYLNTNSFKMQETLILITEVTIKYIMINKFSRRVEKRFFNEET